MPVHLLTKLKIKTVKKILSHCKLLTFNSSYAIKFRPRYFIMGVLTGILVDVSGSMKENFPENRRSNNEQVQRSESIFKTVINIADRKVKSDDDQDIFLQAFGLRDVETCDLLKLLEKSLQWRQIESNSGVKGYEPLIRLLAENGAPNTEEYVKKYMTEDQAVFLYNFYSKSENRSYLNQIIEELPAICKGGFKGYAHQGVNIGLNFFTRGNASLFTNERGKTREHAEKAINNAKDLIRKKYINEITDIVEPEVKNLRSTVDLLNKVLRRNSETGSFNSTDLNNLVSAIDPFIYGYTPMCKAIKSAISLFANTHHKDKVLFLLTDGEATDGDPGQYLSQLKALDIQVIICLITPRNIPEPKKLYYKEDNNWTKPQKKMFQLSSSVKNSHGAMSVLIEHGWTLSPEGESRLFVQANNPEVIDDFSNLARELADNNMILLDIMGRVSLDKYINSAMSSFQPRLQIGGTCYAHATAAVLHLAMHRIVGRVGGYPKFELLRDEMIAKYGTQGAVTEKVLNENCPKYRLRYNKLDELGARQAINARRPVVATFHLDDKQWKKFGQYFHKNPTGILKKSDIGPSTSGKKAGHAVVLIRTDPDSLTFLNSWGKDWADGGFFRVQNQSVLDLNFYDVFWYIDDLKPEEVQAYNEKKSLDSQQFIDQLPDDLKREPYKCPVCGQFSPVNTYVGHLLEVTCPKCKKNFKPSPIGFILNW